MRKIVAGMIGILLILASLHYQPVKAADLYVSTLGSDAGNCQILACKTIGYAVGKAASNDTIHVAAGTYNLEATIIISENLTLQGAGAATTTIDGTGSGVDAINVLSALVNISGFTITGDGDGLYYNGSSGIIINNTIAGNDHDGIDNDNSKPTITNNTISGNHDGIYNENNSGPTITNNTITDNHDLGIYNSASSPIIRNNTITENSYGGISNHSSSNPTILSNTIMGNGGEGVSNVDSSPGIYNNIIVKNGNGIVNNDSSPTITNNTISGNHGDGIQNFRTTDKSDPKITNNIITSNPNGIRVANVGNNPTNTYNDVWGNGTDYDGTSAGVGSISANPLFSSMSPYHLLCGSPAIDAGTNTPPLGIPTDDKDGVARPIGANYDMGAYEGCVLEPRPKPQLPSLLPAVQNHISQGNGLLKQANELLAQAKSKNLDTSTCEKQINEVNELLEKANKVKASPITANYFAIKALEKVKQAVDCLKALLG